MKNILKKPLTWICVAVVVVLAIVLALLLTKCNNEEHVHDFKLDEAAGTAATCTEDGERVYKCACGETKTEKIPALGHDLQDGEPAKDATCTEDGCTAQKKCSRCDHTEGGEKIPALGHDLKVVAEGKDATCTEEGCSEQKKCSRCDHTEGGEAIKALGHDLKKVKDGKAATCTASGVAATYKCSRCDHTEGGGTTKALGHNLKKVNDGKAASCTAGGVAPTYKCSRCDHTEGGKTISALGHDMKKVSDGKAATCTADGVEAAYKCSRCDHREGGKVIKAHGHDWKVLGTVQQATDTQFGIQQIECRHCAWKLKNVTKKTGNGSADGKALQSYLAAGHKLRYDDSNVVYMELAGNLTLSKSEFEEVATFNRRILNAACNCIGKLDIDLNHRTLTVTNASNEWISIAEMLSVKNGTLKLGAVNHYVSYQFWKYVCPIYVPSKKMEMNLSNANVEITADGEVASFALVDDRDAWEGIVTVNAENSSLTVIDKNGKKYTTAAGTAYWRYTDEHPED